MLGIYAKGGCERLMPDESYGLIVAGNQNEIKESYKKWADQPVDQVMMGSDVKSSGFDRDPVYETTLAKPFSVTGPGTFLGKAQRTLIFEPSTTKGWMFRRDDLPAEEPIRVSVDNVWKIVRNIVLRSGSVHNYMRMVEHIIALKIGMELDNVMIRLYSGDPPLFDRSSMDLVEGVEEAGIVDLRERRGYVTVKEPVTIGGANGSFLTFLPAEAGYRGLVVDCAVDFPSAIGKQRIQFKVCRETFRHGAQARTNTTLGMLIYCRTIGKIFADVRNLGYTNKNILIAGRRKYFNEPQLVHDGKSLEAVWHRAVLDLLAAIALIDGGFLAGRVISYKSGHLLDVEMIRQLNNLDLLEKVVG